jgi:hypothetical protein
LAGKNRTAALVRPAAGSGDGPGSKRPARQFYRPGRWGWIRKFCLRTFSGLKEQLKAVFLELGRPQNSAENRPPGNFRIGRASGGENL